MFLGDGLELLLTVVAPRDLDIIQCYITSAHLHGTLKEDIYMGQPDGYTIPGKEARVWRLEKELQGACLTQLVVRSIIQSNRDRTV